MSTPWNKKKYFPMLVSGDTIEEWDKYDRLPKNIQRILTDIEVEKIIYKISVELRLEDDQIKYFSELIRKFFFGETPSNWNQLVDYSTSKYNFPKPVAEKICKVIMMEIALM